MRFLVLTLCGPMVAWGDTAVGERRPSSPSPTRSGLLGLIAAAVGIRRDEAGRLASLEGLSFASRIFGTAELVSDYHTAQVPSSVDLKRQPARDRREELAFKRSDLKTILSRRDYYADVLALTAIWTSTETRPDLESIAEALRAPVFTPYLGRKNCPASLPMEPRLVEAANPLAAIDIVGVPALIPTRWSAGPTVTRWEGEWNGLRPLETVVRRDALRSRERWQFAERAEQVSREPGRHRVPEQD